MRGSMLDYVVRRVVLGLITLFGVAVVVFFIMRVLPGDAAVMLSGAEAGTVSEAEIAEVRKKLGLDRPLSIQFSEWAGKVAVLDLGTSLRTGNPVFADVARRFPYTLQIVVMAMVIAIVVGMTAGMISAAFAGSWGDQIMRAFSIIGLAAPSFWVGLLVILALVWMF
ncbi:MAG: ABC transporter permease, partial [Betaproteobacteria bacterium]